MSRRQIVYPDAASAAEATFEGTRKARLEALGTLRVFEGTPPTDAEFLRRVEHANAVILGWKLPDTVLDAMHNTDVIAFTGIGAASLVNLSLARSKGITVTNTPGYANNTVAEHTIALMLSLSRQIARLDRDTRNGGWNHDLQSFDLRGKTLGLIGFGGIAARTAQLATAFGMNVIAWTRNPSPERANKGGVRFCELDSVLSSSDIVSVHVELNDDTRGLLSDEKLALIQKHALFINTARGEIVDEAALADRLSSGKLGGAGLDVYTEEPLAADHPFRSMDTVVVTPHSAYNTPEANGAIYDIVIDSLEAFYAGHPVNVVN